ncbi:erythroblast NAD(P)(+)--arginine ADP-ribosyltransferase-like [Garra rufa]|uniref:erythroblast NAD(P)(+)--arginine ADP-ribosyltransferase-like n=1 Tax=Garra rufa TaxID=137080 RepID=UPI003CCED23F
MLFVIEALLLISVYLEQDHSTVEGLQLDMALKSVDDYYLGCREEMAKRVETEYLKKDCDGSPEFKEAWEEAKKKALNDNLIIKHENSIAIYVYTNPEIKIYDKFNNDTRNGKQNYTDMTYKWYSLQFLLTEAIKILKKTQSKCFTTFRGTKLVFNEIALPVIRFGSFTSSSFNRDLAKRFGSKSCFEIYTCEGANVTKYSRLNYEQEVLIPPYEQFKVTAVRTRIYQKDLWCETVINLESCGMKSKLNCALFKNTPKTITKYYGLR